MPTARSLPSAATLPVQIPADSMQPYEVGLGKWTNERDGNMDALDLAKGFTVEASITLGPSEQDHFFLRLFARSGCTMCNRYWLSISNGKVAYWYGGAWQALPSKQAGSGTYRLCIRPDTCVQIYRNDTLLQSFPASYEIGFAPPTRGNWLEWELSSTRGSSAVHKVAYSLDGPLAPPAAV